MTSPTPIVDRVLSDPLGVPTGVDRWLRRIEERARELQVRAADAASGHADVLDVLREALEELERFLGDVQKSALHRLLRRPISQLTLDSPAARSFDSYCRGMFERVGEAVGVQEEAGRLLQELDRLRRTYQGWFPRSLALHLREAELQHRSVIAARRLTDIAAMGTRLKRVESLMAGLAEACPDTVPPDSVVGGDGEAPTLAELRALTRLRLRSRENPASALSHGARLQHIRQLGASQINSLGASSSWRPSASHPSHSTAQALADAAFSSSTMMDEAGADAPLWAALLGAATGARTGRIGKGWFPKISEPVIEGDSPGSVTTYFALPLDSEYALITREHESRVAVVSRRMGMDEQIECSLHASSSGACDSAEATAEIAPFFDGILPGKPARYQTRRPARLRIVAVDGESWYARILEKGAVRNATTGSLMTGGAAGSVEVLYSRSAGRTGAADTKVDVLPNRESEFGGIRNQVVRAPIAHTGDLWLRTLAARGGNRIVRPLEAEHELWVELARTGAAVAPEPRGRARGRDEREAGFLYQPPFAIRASESRPLQQWISANSGQFARALAELFLVLREAGFALGVYHFDALEFGVRHDAKLALTPKAVIVYGGAAARFGDAFHALDRPERSVYERLRFRGVAPPVAGKQVASAETDVLCLGLMFLELFAVRSLGAGNQWYSWDEMLKSVASQPEQFVRPKLALQLAAALSEEGGGEKLLHVVEALAKPA